MTVLKKFYDTQARIFLNELNIKKVDVGTKTYNELKKQLETDREELKKILTVIK